MKSIGLIGVPRTDLPAWPGMPGTGFGPAFAVWQDVAYHAAPHGRDVPETATEYT
jgi:hypothetical protein